MRLLEPTLFHFWALLAVVPVVLYLFRPRPKTVRTSTLPFFKWLAREHQDAAWLRWLKHLLSLLLSILVVLLASAALGRLVVAPEEQDLKTVVILVDRSASMAAALPEKPNRLEEAVVAARNRLAGLPAGVGVIVMAYDRRPEVLLSRSLERRQVDRALASLRVRPAEGDAEAALALAKRLASLETPAAIWHFTDHVGSGHRGADAAGSPLVEHFALALPEAVNVGITAVDVRRLPLEKARYEAFVEVHASGPKPVSAELEVKLDGTLVSLRKLTIPPGRRERLLVPLDGRQDADRVLSLSIHAPGDRLAWDDAVHVRVPLARPVRVLWISDTPDPFTQLALAALGAESALEVFQGKPDSWPPKDRMDVVLLDGWLPKTWPNDVACLVVDPPRSLGPFTAVRLKAGLPLESVRSGDEGHPLLYGVSTQRLSLLQTAVIESAGPLETIWTGSAGPVLLAGEVRGQRVAVAAFSPQRSENLPLTASYPLLLGNAIYWASEDRRESARGMNRRTCELVELKGKTLTWRDPADPKPAVTQTLAGRWTELDRPGLWETDAGESGSAALLSSRETLLPSAPGPRQDTEAAAPSAGGLQGDLGLPLALGVLVLLILESWLYHRYLAY